MKGVLWCLFHLCRVFVRPTHDWRACGGQPQSLRPLQYLFCGLKRENLSCNLKEYKPLKKWSLSHLYWFSRVLIYISNMLVFEILCLLPGQFFSPSNTSCMNLTFYTASNLAFKGWLSRKTFSDFLLHTNISEFWLSLTLNMIGFKPLRPPLEASVDLQGTLEHFPVIFYFYR